MPSRPELTHPGDATITAAMSRTLTALAAVFQALGDGEHTLSLAAQRTDAALVTARADHSTGTQQLRLAVLDAAEFCALRTQLMFAMEGSTMRSAVLIATTAAEPSPRACGWTVRNGWLHPMDTAALQHAVIPCPGVSAVPREVYTAPVLPFPETDEEEPRA
ncbi:hypothetical protein ACFU3O_36770 [Streptomyces antibioticus]|uniref:hypothetical protein n=1 Tax=Streptomyces antibioticus TaxID=1890 RepID=UPI0036B305AF